MMEVVLLYLRYLLIGPYPNGPLIRAALTLWMVLWTCMMATAVDIGCVLLLGRLGATSGLRRLACLLRGLLATLRVTSVLMLMFWMYFLIPMAPGVSVLKTAAVAAALAVVGAAYIIQSAETDLRAVGIGQHNAVLVLGTSSPQASLTTMLSQAWRIMLSSLVDQWVLAVKDTLLIYTVGMAELSTAASQVNSHMVAYPAKVFDVVTILYFPLCTGTEALPNWLCVGPRTPVV